MGRLSLDEIKKLAQRVEVWKSIKLNGNYEAISAEGDIPNTNLGIILEKQFPFTIKIKVGKDRRQYKSLDGNTDTFDVLLGRYDSQNKEIRNLYKSAILDARKRQDDMIRESRERDEHEKQKYLDIARNVISS